MWTIVHGDFASCQLEFVLIVVLSDQTDNKNYTSKMIEYYCKKYGVKIVWNEFEIQNDVFVTI